MNTRLSIVVLFIAALVILSTVAGAQTTQTGKVTGPLPATQPTMEPSRQTTSAPSTRAANSLAAAATQPATARSLEGPECHRAVEDAARLAGRTFPSVPNATICTVRGWADQTKEYQVSQRILAASATDAGPTKVKHTASVQQEPKQGESDPATLLRPICSAADIEGLTSTDLVEGVFRPYSREDYLGFAQRKDRPLIVNWIEDYPKILAAQCEHWNFPARFIAPGSLPQFDLSTFKPNTENEFEFHRLEEEYAKLEAQRSEIFSRNLHVGPTPGWKQPVLFVMRAKLAKYDFAGQRYELKTPMVHGAAGLMEYFKAPGEAFDGCVVLMGGGRRWEIAYMPLAEAPAEKLRKEKAEVILLVEGYVYYPNKFAVASSDLGAARSVFMYISKVTFIAVPEGNPLYQVAVFETGDKAGRY